MEVDHNERVTELRDLEASALREQRSGRFGEAAAVWERLIALNDRWEHGYPHYHLADCYTRLGRLDDAERAYVKAMEVAREDDLFRDALGSLRTAREGGLIR